MINNLVVSKSIIKELVQQGVSIFVISPGSRSTPLTVAAARDPMVKTAVHFDERGAAYFALGHAKATGKPAVLICTSGTAVSNYFPAVIEASMDNIPLIILSADRPPELIDVGANQAIFQDNIYGNYPRLFKNLEPPGQATTSMEIVTLVSEIVHAAMGPRPGPVHLNCQFREPLLPPHPEAQQADNFANTRSVIMSSDSPEIHNRIMSTEIPLKSLQKITEKITDSSKGIIIIGRTLNSQFDDAVLDLAQSLNWPVFPDVQSRLRFFQHPNLINHFDLALLKDDLFTDKPELVIHLGGAFTSKRLLNYLNDSEIFYISVKETPERIDPNHQINIALTMHIKTFCESIQSSKTDHIWINSWQQSERHISNHVREQLDHIRSLNEPGISYHLSKLVPVNHSLMLANSMAIREMEMFATINHTDRILANRGASGIDGLLATAAGFQAGSGKALTLLIGDLAVLHDLNSLALIAKASHPLIIVLINNNGGGIFNFLPVRAESDVFESFFGTPHGWTFKKSAEMFALKYANPIDMSEFIEVYSAAASGTDSMLIELFTDRSKNQEFHQEIFHTIRGI